MQTVRHFFPDLNAWLDRLPDPRTQEAIIYDRRFLAWWGIALFLFCALRGVPACTASLSKARIAVTC